MTEMITVIVSCQLYYGFFKSPFFFSCQFTNFRLKITESFFFGNTAESCIFRIKADVTQVVEYREKRNLCKLSDTRNEDKLLVFVLCFQDGKHFSIDTCARLVLRSLPRMLQWRIVFIDKNCYLLACFITSSFYDVLKSYSK